MGGMFRTALDKAKGLSVYREKPAEQAPAGPTPAEIAANSTAGLTGTDMSRLRRNGDGRALMGNASNSVAAKALLGQ